MAKKKDALVIGLLAGAAACLVAWRLSRENKQPTTFAAQGFAAFTEGKFEEALVLLLQVKEADFNVNLKIYECYMQLGNLTSGLAALNKCIAMRRAEELVLKRFKLHMALDMEQEAFKDLFLVNLMSNDNTHKDNASDFLKKLCAGLAKTHKIDGFASPINYGDFFETLLFLKGIQDPAVVFINSGEYSKCFDFLKENESSLHRLLLGCFYLINGDFTSALRCFEQVIAGGSDMFQYGEILRLFIRSKKLTKRELDELKARIDNEADPTVLFYIARIFESVDERTLQYEALQKCIAASPNSSAFSSLIVWYIRQGNHTEAMRLIKLALKDFPECMNLVCITLEYYLMRKNLEEAVCLMERTEKMSSGDPRVFLFKYMISEAMGKPDLELLKRGISLDRKYFKQYIYLGNACASGEESVVAYREALKCARSYDEIFTAYQLLVVIETQNELFKEHPDLFASAR